MHAHIGLEFAHARARVAGFAKSIAQGIFDFQPHKIEAFHLRPLAFHFHLKGLLERKPVAPFDVAGELIDVVFIAVAAFGELKQHAAGGARMQIGAIHLLQAAFAGHTAVGRLDLSAALRLQFRRQHVFQAARAGDKKRVNSHGLPFGVVPNLKNKITSRCIRLFL